MEGASTSGRRKSSASTLSTTISTASSPTTSTPTSAASPPATTQITKATASSTAPPRVAIRPNAAVKAASLVSSPINRKPMAPGMVIQPTSNEARPLSMTSKEWIIPPRPKPGRKPATDTPPTRRKAQNRAAQRAFRERRAARVGELEEQLDEQKDDHERLVRELQTRITQLELESQNLQAKCQWLEGQLEQERMSKGTTGRNWDDASSIRNNSINPYDGQHSDQSRLSATSPIDPSRPGAQPFSISQIISPPDEMGGSLDIGCGSCSPDGPCACAEEVLASANLNIGCGNCGIGTRCKCLEDSLAATAVQTASSRRRPGSPLLPAGDDKRPRLDDTSPMETDFTEIFAGNRNASASLNPQAATQPPVLVSVEPRDSCGFCKDGTYCVCADALANSAVLPLPSRQTVSAQTRTPPPSEGDVVLAPIPMEVTATGAIKLPRVPLMQRGRATNPRRSLAAPSKGCGPNGPGTCAQCLSDPKSGLFCRSLAANFERNSRQGGLSAGGCCGQGGPGGCCKGGDGASTKTPGLSLSCAETDKTLASHRNFDEAADEIGTWLPKLKAVPTPDAQGTQPPIRLAPIEVEAASIMSVLKEFDVRFGRGE